MSVASSLDWRQEFGLSDRKPPNFFASKEDLDRSAPQAHVIRRAFDLLNLDGVLCSENTPLVYFKQVERFEPRVIAELHRRFWNHGCAPILVLISIDRIHIYSGLCRPVAATETEDQSPSLVEVIDRIESAWREFLISVESGEFFRKNKTYFNPEHRVDRDLLDNLKAARDQLEAVSSKNHSTQFLDALLCRLVFTCYLFDREVMGAGYLNECGIRDAQHPRDILAIGATGDAKNALYLLFDRLKTDFNGDMFGDELESEAKFINAKHIKILHNFFSGIDVNSGQRSFWAYDFGVIPIETISAIYERFLKPTDKKAGAFYTPRFLAEVVLDCALDGVLSILGKTFLDPACGSGIFLVGLFNRMAEEWTQANPTARNDRRAGELMRILRESLFGVDINPTACRITAFSLYLAYLDQLSPRDIQELQRKGRALPRLIVTANENSDSVESEGVILCADFFSENVVIPKDVSLIVGNPPWGSIAKESTRAGRWCDAHDNPLPDKQIAAAFVWKASEHVSIEGRICFVLPHGLLFHHSTKAVDFQKAWLERNAIERVLNLADFRWFLFEITRHPAIVVSYRKTPPKNNSHRIDYWSPKADWSVTQAEFITVDPVDRSTISYGEIMKDLGGPDAPQIWKQRFWATPRDQRLIDRLSLYHRLSDQVRQTNEPDEVKPWIMAVGFQPFGENDSPSTLKKLNVPSQYFIPARSKSIDLILLEDDCETLTSNTIDVRRLIRNCDIFRAPHVIITKGFTKVCFCDFDVSFEEAMRGIHGPSQDRDLLIFLAAYLRTPLAKYFLFHTSSSWAIGRPEVHVQELLRLPLPFPDQSRNPTRSREIVAEVARIVTSASKQAEAGFMDRKGIVREASNAVEPLIEEYFDILPLEKLLIEDTIKIIIPSIQPRRNQMPVSTVEPSTTAQRKRYRDRVRDMLNGWAKNSPFTVRGEVYASVSLGIGIAVFEMIEKSAPSSPMPDTDFDLLKTLNRLRTTVARSSGSLNLLRGVIVFDRNRLYVVKPIGQRYWCQSAALNDADEIAGTILMRSSREDA